MTDLSTPALVSALVAASYHLPGSAKMLTDHADHPDASCLWWAEWDGVNADAWDIYQGAEDTLNRCLEPFGLVGEWANSGLMVFYPFTRV